MDERAEEDVLDLVRGQTRLNFDPGATSPLQYRYTLSPTREQVSGDRSGVHDEAHLQAAPHTSTCFRDTYTELEAGSAYGYTGSSPGEFGLWVPNFDLVADNAHHSRRPAVGRNLLSPRGLLPHRQGAGAEGNGGRRVGVARAWGSASIAVSRS